MGHPYRGVALLIAMTKTATEGRRDGLRDGWRTMLAFHAADGEGVIGMLAAVRGDLTNPRLERF